MRTRPVLSSSDENLVQVRQFVQVLFKLGEMIVVVVAFLDLGTCIVDALLKIVRAQIIRRNGRFSQERAASRAADSATRADGGP